MTSTSRRTPLLLAAAALLFAAGAAILAEAQTPATQTCAAKLAPCADYMNSTNPPDTCCNPIRQAVATERACLCNLYNTPSLLASLGINVTQALQLTKECGVSADTGLCNAGNLKSALAMASTVEPERFAGHWQHVLVMRHGDRADDGADYSWWTRVPKPWDASLTDAGRIKALETGKKLRAQLGVPIHRVVSSPFRRCVETARELIAGLSTEGDGATNVAPDDGNSADTSKSGIKASIEYGMSEVFNDVSLWYHPTDRDSWGFDMKKLEASFPPGVADPTPHRVFEELPQWGESQSGAQDRYLLTIRSLVDKYPEENLLFVTHSEGVKITASTYWKEARERKLRPDYCGYVHLRRQVVRNSDSFTAGRFKIANPSETGIKLEPIRHV